MLKILSLSVLLAGLGLAAVEVQAFPAPAPALVDAGGVQIATGSGPGLHLAATYKRRYIRPPHGNGNWHGNNHWNHHHRPNWYRPYYYRPNYWGWGPCGWGNFGALPYDCLRGGYYGGYYYGDGYDDAVPRQRVSNSRHVKWCKARYKTYNVKTDTFIGKGKKKYRCNSPYDGRR